MSFELMNHAIVAGSWQFVNLESLRDTVAQDFKYLILKKRYSEYCLWAKGTLSYNETGFHLGDFTFEKLDEVEKALNNKTFL